MYNIVSVEVIGKNEPYLKYIIMDKNNIKHVFRVNSLKQLNYVLYLKDLK